MPGKKKRKQSSLISHLLAVAALVLEEGGSETEAIAALLHDAVEDQGGRERLAEIKEEFGPEVADIVEGCSDAFEEPKPEWGKEIRGKIIDANFIKEQYHSINISFLLVCLST